MTQNIKQFIENGEKELLNLKCVDGAMYFGSVEDDSCNCKTRCQNEQTFEHATEELKQFISSRQISLIKMIQEIVESEKRNPELVEIIEKYEFGEKVEIKVASNEMFNQALDTISSKLKEVYE